jgi:hypothetical protein
VLWTVRPLSLLLLLFSFSRVLFRRWDTPGHVLIDDGPNPFSDSDPQNADRDQSKPTQIWPGKDYSNQRVLDFHTLNKPEEDMYDRGKVPRQPWCVTVVFFFFSLCCLSENDADGS